MTDFFGDLEREIRAAHPRRSRATAPAGPLLVAAVALLAVFAALSLLPDAEREVAQSPPAPAEEGWTAYAPASADCGTEVVEGPAPQALLDRFAVLREPGESGKWNGGPPTPARVYPDASRAVGKDGARALILPVEFAGTGCDDLQPGVCLIAQAPPADTCVVLSGDRMLGLAVADEPQGLRTIYLLAEDAVQRLRYDSPSTSGELEMAGNWFMTRTRAKPTEKVRLTVLDEPGCRPDLPALQQRLAMFRRPAHARAPEGVEVPAGAFPEEVRRAGGYAVFPRCGTELCLASASRSVCGELRPGVVLTLAGDGETAALVTDDVRRVRIGDRVVTPREGVARAPARHAKVEVTPAS